MPGLLPLETGSSNKAQDGFDPPTSGAYRQEALNPTELRAQLNLQGSYLPVPGGGPGKLTECCLCSSSQSGCPEMGVSATSGGPWGLPGHRSPHARHCPVLRGGYGRSRLAVVGCSLRGSPEAGLGK